MRLFNDESLLEKVLLEGNSTYLPFQPFKRESIGTTWKALRNTGSIYTGLQGNRKKIQDIFEFKEDRNNPLKFIFLS